MPRLPRLSIRSFPALLWVLLVVGIVVWTLLVWLTFTQRIR
jgi:hypothetical protein